MHRLLQGDVGVGQDGGRRDRAARRGAGRPPGRAHGADRGAGRAALPRRPATCSTGFTVADGGDAIAVRRAAARASSCSPTARRRRSASGCAAGAAPTATSTSLIGTHALIQEGVAFRSLGVVVIDEQHRFGVEQRAALRAKGADGTVPDVLVMTATPIPRTAAMTVYGDLDVSVLDEMPPGRDRRS